MDSFYKKITNSRFYSWGDKLGDIIIVSVLWLICCIPVVTFIPSSIALYYTVNKSKKSELSVSKMFFGSFKDNLRQGVLVNIIYSLYMLIPSACIFFGVYGIGDVKLPDAYLPFSLVTLIPVVFTLPFVIALLARFDNDIKTTFKNAFTLSAMNLMTTLYIWLIIIIALPLMVLFPPCALVVPAIACKFIVPKCEKVFGIANKVVENRNNPVEDVEASDEEDYDDEDEYEDDEDDEEDDMEEDINE